jgi:hypothetical protein
LIVAIFNALYPDLRNKIFKPHSSKLLAGNVVEQTSKLPVGRAAVTIVGRMDQCTTDDSGYFQIVLPADAPDEVRLQVSAPGFNAIDRNYVVSDHLYLVLTRQ